MIRAPGRRLLRCLLGCLLALWCGAAVAGKIYRWTDAQGQVHFSDQPGARDAQPVHLRPAPPPDPQTARRRAQTDKLLQAIDQDGAEKASRERKAAARAARRQENCRRARQRLSDASRARYLYTQKGGGPRHILSAHARSNAVRQMRSDVKKYCN
ncbi:MAG: DUF4124 domain-containing protein [Pseudolabrys sp.]